MKEFECYDDVLFPDGDSDPSWDGFWGMNKPETALADQVSSLLLDDYPVSVKGDQILINPRTMPQYDAQLDADDISVVGDNPWMIDGGEG
jgi:hypothetical protein